MKTHISLPGLRSACLTIFTATVFLTGQAQTTSTWIGSAGDSDWNTAANWDFGIPAEGTNATIGAGASVNYNLPMAPGSFGALTLNSPLNVNAGGFVVGASGNAAISVSGTGAKLFVNNGGAVSVTNGGLSFISGGGGALAAGSLISMTGTLLVGNNSTPFTGFLTNQGGFLSAGATTVNPNNQNVNCLLLINGGTNNLGTVTILRSSASSFGNPGGEGLVINNGSVSMTGLNVGTAGANSYLTMYVTGGTVTNSGPMVVRQATSGRGARFLQTGGLMATTDPNLVRVAVTNAGQIGIYSVTGGTNMAYGFLLGDITNSSGTVNFTNAAKVYVGGGGITANTIATLNVALNNGGTFGANADWTASVPMILSSGTFTFNAADLAGTAHNITLNGRLSGSGTLVKAGSGTLTLGGTNTFTGSTTVNQGTLALATNGSIAGSSQIFAGSGGTFDVSAISNYTVAVVQKLAGLGAVVGAVTVPSGAFVQPAGNGAAGTLNFLSGLAETGGAINNFDLSDDPTGITKTNDLLNIIGNLVLSGTNTVQVNPLNGPLPGNSTYKLIQYSGTLVGDATNFSLGGAVGSIVVDPTARTVSLVVQGATRSPTNLVWLGNASANNWQTFSGSNWLNNATLDVFVTGDNARFDATGAANSAVNVVGSVSPGSIVVDAAANYSFTGSGSIDGSGSLVKTNAGTLVVLTTNNYGGPTIIGGGAVECVRLANSGNASSLGAAGSDPSGLVFYSSTLRYLGGNTSTDRGATFNDAGGTLDVATNTTTLTMSGSLLGGGGLTKSGPGTLILSAANSYAGNTTLSNGVLQVNATISAISTGAVNFAGGGLNLNVSAQQTYPNALNVLGTGAITSAGGNNNIFTGPWSGAGTVNVSIASGGVFSLSGNLEAGFAGTIGLGNSAGTLRFNSGGSDPCKGSSNVVFDLGTNTAVLVNRNGGTYGTTTYFLGGLAGGPGTRLQGSANTGSPNTYEVGGTGANTTFAGTIANGAGGSSALITLSKVGNGTLTLSGTNTYSGVTFVTNGVLALSAYGSIGSSTTIKVVTNAFLDVSARADGALILNNNQTLLGDGTILGSVTARSGSAVSPGEVGGLPARLTITNALVFQNGSTNVMDLDYYQLAGGMTNDQISGLSSVTYSGTLGLVITSIETNSIFKLFSAAAYQGAFSTINILVGGLPMGTAWDTSYLTVDGTLRVVPLRPSFNPPVLTGSDITLSGINGTPFATYSVLVSTSAALPLTQWTAVTTNTFNFDGSFNVTIPINPGWPQAFYELLMQ